MSLAKCTPLRARAVESGRERGVARAHLIDMSAALNATTRVSSGLTLRRLVRYAGRGGSLVIDGGALRPTTTQPVSRAKRKRARNARRWAAGSDVDREERAVEEARVAEIVARVGVVDRAHRALRRGGGRRADEHDVGAPARRQRDARHDNGAVEIDAVERDQRQRAARVEVVELHRQRQRAAGVEQAQPHRFVGLHVEPRLELAVDEHVARAAAPIRDVHRERRARAQAQLEQVAVFDIACARRRQSVIAANVARVP